MTRSSLFALPGLALAALLSLSAPAAATPSANPPTAAALATACEGRDGWSDAAPPAPVFGNTWYVGTCGISAVLVTGDKGHVLVDGGTKQAAPLILANIRRLGFDPKDVRWIVSSHEHDDHAGALAELKRLTGARVAALAAERPFLEAGQMGADDPQSAIGKPFDPVRVDRVLKDGDSIVLGRTVLTAHATPTHSPGSTSWTWQACDAAFACHMVAYADSATTISADGYRFTDHAARVEAARAGIAAIGALPCDILLTPHPSASAMMERFAGSRPLVDAGACRAYADAAQRRLDARLDAEAKGTAK